MNNEEHETYCDYNLTNLLIKSGFDWQDYFVAHSIDEHFHWEIPLHIAQKWLREVKNIEIVPWRWPTKVMFVEGYKPWSYKLIEYQDLEGVDIEDFNASGEDYFKSYEEAQESGIKKALEIILEKGE